MTGEPWIARTYERPHRAKLSIVPTLGMTKDQTYVASMKSMYFDVWKQTPLPEGLSNECLLNLVKYLQGVEMGIMRPVLNRECNP